MISFVDICSGIGAGRLGLEKNGFKCIGYSEILSTSIENYKLFFNTKDEIEFGDLTKIEPNKMPDFNMLIAGFPCQSYSIQGLRKGLDDERGQIIFYIKKILEAKKVKYFILENVKGLINHNSGSTLNVIINLLEEANYKVYYKVLKSNDYGLPQKRERVYFIGIRKDLENTNYTFPEPNKEKPELKNFLIDRDEKYIYHNYEWFNRYLNNKYNIGKYNIDDILKQDYLVLDIRQSDLRLYPEYMPTLRTGRSGLLYVKNGLLRKISGRESLLLQGFGKDIYDKAKGLTDSLLLQQTGNAMSVNVIEELANQLKIIMKLNGDL